METIIVPAIPAVPMSLVQFPLLNLAQPAPAVEVAAMERRRKRRRH